jgi:hypothetical protein
MSIGKDRSPTQERLTKHGFVMTHEAEWNFGSITPLFSNCTPDYGAMENNRVMTPKSRSDSWLVTNTTLCHPLWGYSKRDNSGPSHLICMTHMRHVGLKWVTHRFRYTTYIFNRTMQWFWLNPTTVFNRIIHRKNMNIAYRSRLHMKIRTLHIKI